MSGRRTGGGGGGRRRGADTELKTKTPHVNVGKKTYLRSVMRQSQNALSTTVFGNRMAWS